MDSLSLALGSLHCITCSNFYILSVIPFALAGVALVAIILLLHLTVDVGTINGLLFFANIIQANHQAFFPRSINFFTVFISWLNLDLGIETCFYDSGCDENIGFFTDPGHIVLAAFVILMPLCLFLPYTLILLLSSGLVTPDRCFLLDQQNQTIHRCLPCPL